MAWDLGDDAARPAGAGAGSAGDIPSVLSAERRTVVGLSGPIKLEKAGALNLEAASDSARLRIPADFYLLLRETDVQDPEVRRIPLDWRLRTREAFQTLFGRGFRVAAYFDILPGESGPGYILRRS